MGVLEFLRLVALRISMLRQGPWRLSFEAIVLGFSGAAAKGLRKRPARC
jgi:hypothetical protein